MEHTDGIVAEGHNSPPHERELLSVEGSVPTEQVSLADWPGMADLSAELASRQDEVLDQWRTAMSNGDSDEVAHLVELAHGLHAIASARAAAQIGVSRSVKSRESAKSRE